MCARLGGTVSCCVGEGPSGLIICPSRELARQTYEVILGYTSQLAAAGQPQLHTLLCIGGIDMKEQTDKFKHAGMSLITLSRGALPTCLLFVLPHWLLADATVGCFCPFMVQCIIAMLTHAWCTASLLSAASCIMCNCQSIEEEVLLGSAHKQTVQCM